MLSEERQAIIRDRLAEQGKVLANALALEFRVSEDTVRRDLRDLAKAGFCRRVYGGALARSSATGTGGGRLKISVSDLAAPAATATKLVQPGAVILMDQAALSVACAAALPRDMALTVVTNAPSVATALSGHRQVRVVLLGGLYDQDKGCSFGPVCLSQLEQFHADFFFAADCAIDASVGLTAFDLAEAEIKRAMCRRSIARVAFATADRMSRVAPFQVSGPGEIDHLVVGRQLTAESLQLFSKQGTVIHRALGGPNRNLDDRRPKDLQQDPA
ncbi:DeoR/GlpR transcriptional regulator [Mesorhizobium sp. M4B.F.Ca.ET.215.01.1.1]|uniref:DeoR/GlpR family DNA-binding transcription regulator n=2 Tax=Mesorhizobium TaxID=68287 RepID=UPI000FCAFBEE|nr:MULTISPECIES: DeoR/GlpR family DNA-binding transcription regulator [unclassified Mesorhizobium]RUW27103.1 DeoR/GlpR transcriptional regulator [Mesorhizobium sp. M4B.F.Ca.ET.013.02.1.1]RUW77966.1 DeoR/GlpR transcriptional regulator [Mesorhizobium sp. M4B.F.Ca.ET.049.02.1.2]RWF67146.1 MAG: DeoR/GlpR transcriptional regulator [Mesorhizobium sp.]TGQ09556.1 DeoR/GlpR transcriptional regulator [Mesorhizobium sp. M4B.F.Ca.ET.215.01.1.1]TGQ36990.1 DeoR/GlpR transcriptional regulator [Mesorhizobium 